MTNTYDSAHHPRNQVLKDGKWVDKTQTPGDMTLSPGRYATSTPAECDTELATLFDKRGTVARYLHGEVERLAAHEAEAAHRAANDGTALHRWNLLHGYDLANVQRSIGQYRTEIAELDAQIDPIDEEFTARGGWTRFFLVRASNGHIHSSMSCVTCFPTTQYSWLPERSGSDEAETVEMAGDSACTICYPSAPVADRHNPRPNRLDTAEDRAHRLAREAEKAAKAAKKLATGISNPDGTELREASDKWGSGREIKTERAAELKAVDILYTALWDARYLDGAAPTEQSRLSNERDERTFDRIVPALAAKRGQSVEEVREFLTAKAAAKFAKELRSR
jgi:hypothetical protein